MFRLTLLTIFALELFSFTTHWFPNWQLAGFVLVLGLLLAISIKNLKYGVFVAIIELIIGSQGHLLSTNIAGFQFSLRMGIFCIVMFSTLIYILKNRTKIVPTFKKLPLKYLLPFAVLILWGIAWALIRGNSLGLIFSDVNAYFYFLYLIPFSFVLPKITAKEFWQLFSVSIFALCLKTLILVYLFSHYFDYINLYKWIRETGWGELVFIPGETFRLFVQSHIFALIGFIVFIILFLTKPQTHDQSETRPWYGACLQHGLSSKRLITLCILCSSVIIISLSRSIWVALAGTSFFFLIYIIKKKWGTKKIFQSIGIFILFFAIGFSLFQGFFKFPYPAAVQFKTNDLLKDRFDTSDPAATTRWAQLPALGEAISEHPVIGSGFGTTITYESSDPRIKNKENPDGTYTAYAFEWAYLDILLKIGLAGLIAYLLLIFKIGKRTLQHSPALFFGLIALLLTHIFTPYINHPLGIGYLIILLSLNTSCFDKGKNQNAKTKMTN